MLGGGRRGREMEQLKVINSGTIFVSHFHELPAKNSCTGGVT